jgi:hypothetical protein
MRAAANPIAARSSADTCAAARSISSSPRRSVCGVAAILSKRFVYSTTA